MMPTSKWALLFLSGIFIISLFSCTHEPFSGDPSNTDTLNSSSNGLLDIPCSADSVYFVNTIKPLINSSCATSGCHDATSHRDGLNLTTYAGILGIVSPGNATNSTLFNIIRRTDGERMPPPPQPAMTTDQISLIQKWINQGAKNNSCSSCDTTNFKYSTAVKPLIQNKCQGCHNPSALGGGIDLSTYTGVRTVALDGRLHGSIAWLAGYVYMPKNSSKLSTCEITQVQKWINNGAPND
ncbi:MAG: c-type cytochrome domain-containing protein [Chitinophagaceae bacterium]